MLDCSKEGRGLWQQGGDNYVSSKQRLLLWVLGTVTTFKLQQ
jgi:hypothetical protein